MAAILGDLANIKADSCSMQAVESFLPIQSEQTAISKAITQSCNQNCITNLEHGSSKLEKVMNVDNYHLATRQRTH